MVYGALVSQLWAEQSWYWECKQPSACSSACLQTSHPAQANANQQIETWIFNFWQGSHQGVNLVVYLSTFWCSQFGQIMPRFLTNPRKYLTNCALRRRRYFAFCDRRKVFAALTVNKMLSLICKRQERVSAPRVPHTRIRWIETRRGKSGTINQAEDRDAPRFYWFALHFFSARIWILNIM